MKVQIDKKEKNSGELLLTINEEDYLPEFNKTLKEHSKKVQMKGFRPGKVPFGLVKKMYGTQVKIDVVQETLQSSLSKAIEENDLKLVFFPKMVSQPLEQEQIVNGTEFDFKFNLFFEPEFELTLDESFKVKGFGLEITDADVEKTIADVKKNYPNMSEGEAIEEGDFVKVQVDEVEGDFSKETLLPLNQVAEDAKAGFLGLKKEEVYKFDLRTAFPEDKTVKLLLGVEEEEAAALKGEFEIKVLEISRSKDAEMDKEFFQKVLGPETKVETEEEFKAEIKDILEKNNGNGIKWLNNDAIKDEIMAKIDFEMPDELLKDYYKDSAGEKFTEEKMVEEWDDFLAGVKWQTITQKLSRDFEVKVEQMEVVQYAQSEIQSQFANYGMPLSQEQLQQYTQSYLFGDNGAVFRQKESDLLVGKLLEQITEKVTIEPETLTLEKLNEIIAEKNKEAEEKMKKESEAAEAAAETEEASEENAAE
ncbi:trigger factor [Flammeovirgaceae bacterium SG7u.111]|nr:trigger factor [Flammeovirgaceae bacterium SG7u.132]WPO37451.1 trigger factor [Flammeovirgaceae bacterium SG7u.111]